MTIHRRRARVLKITRVRSRLLEYEMGISVDGGRGAVSKKESLLIEVHTDTGLVGYGEANTWFSAPGLRAAIDEMIAPLLVGEDPADIEYLWEKIYRKTSPHGRRGLLIIAMGGVDIALWDLLGKELSVPVYRLLGGRTNKKVRAYASGLYPRHNLQELQEEAVGYLKQGFRAMKQRIGMGYARDAELVRAVREAIGNEPELMADVCTAWTPIAAEDEAIRARIQEEGPARLFARRLLAEIEPYKLSWVEEPLPPDDLDGLAELAAHALTPIAIGENVFTRYEAREVLIKGSCHILQPDVTRCGGISEARKIAAMASAWHRQCVPHVWGSIVALAANLHFITATPNCTYLEYDTLRNPLRTEIAKDPLLPVDGVVSAPDRPGLGVELDESVLRKFETARG